MVFAGIRAAVVQVVAGREVRENLAKATQLVEAAARRGARLVVLPENFAFMGPESERVAVAEKLGEGPVSRWGFSLARRLGLELLLGGIPEASPVDGKVYNTALLIGPEGILGTYRKIHLFDVDVPGGPAVRESDHTLAGREVVCLQRPWGRLGLSICYDLRFPELYRRLASEGAHVIAVPAGFTLETGRAHWEILVRARAVENQAFVLAANLAGHHFGNRRSYGHSMIVDPWGEVLASVPEGDGLAVADLEPERLRRVRSQLPALSHRVLECGDGMRSG